MPYIRIETNVTIDGDKADKVIAAVIAASSAASGKPVTAFQGCLVGGLAMRIADAAGPTAYVDYKSVGANDKAKALSAAICGALKGECAIPGDRVYISFQTFERTMWGKDSTTLG